MIKSALPCDEESWKTLEDLATQKKHGDKILWHLKVMHEEQVALLSDKKIIQMFAESSFDKARKMPTLGFDSDETLIDMIFLNLNSTHAPDKIIIKNIFGKNEIETIEMILGFAATLEKKESNEAENMMKFRWAATNVLNLLPEKSPTHTPRPSNEDSKKMILRSSHLE